MLIGDWLPPQQLSEFRDGLPGILRVVANNMLNSDEPNHTRLRGIADEAFRRRAVLDMEPRIRAIADELAADLYLHRAALPTSSSDMRDSCL